MNDINNHKISFNPRRNEAKVHMKTKGREKKSKWLNKEAPNSIIIKSWFERLQLISEALKKFNIPYN
jgi:hypothetical protein